MSSFQRSNWAAQKLTPIAGKEIRMTISRDSFREIVDTREWLRKKIKIEAPYETVRGWLGKLGARLKVVRPRHPNSSELKRFCFRNQLARDVRSTQRTWDLAS